MPPTAVVCFLLALVNASFSVYFQQKEYSLTLTISKLFECTFITENIITVSLPLGLSSYPGTVEFVSDTREHTRWQKELHQQPILGGIEKPTWMIQTELTGMP